MLVAGLLAAGTALSIYSNYRNAKDKQAEIDRKKRYSLLEMARLDEDYQYNKQQIEEKKQEAAGSLGVWFAATGTSQLGVPLTQLSNIMNKAAKDAQNLSREYKWKRQMAQEGLSNLEQAGGRGLYEQAFIESLSQGLNTAYKYESGRNKYQED